MAVGIQRESLVRGTLITAVALFLVRAGAAVYKPAVVRLFAPFDGHHGVAGSGIAQAPSTAYLLALSFTSIGFNVAIARLVAERAAAGDMAGARKVFRTSLFLMLALGLAAAALFAAGAPWLERFSRLKGTAPGYVAIAPAIVLMSVTAAFRGLYQGMRWMSLNAYSQMAEGAVRIAAGVTLVWLLAPRSVILGAVGFNLGDVAGAAVALAYALWCYWRLRADLWGGGSGEGVSTRETLAVIMRVGVPTALLGAAPPLMTYLDLLTLGRVLPDLSEDGLNALFGMLGNGLSIVWLPAVLTGALQAALVPALAEAAAQGRRSEALRLAAMAYRATLLVGLPATVGMAVLAGPAYRLIFNTSEGADLFGILALAALPIMLQQVSAGVQQGLGRVGAPLAGLGLGMAVKVVLTLALVPRLGPAGAAWATAAGFGIAAACNLLSVRRRLGAVLPGAGAWVRPAAAAAVMGLAVYGLDLLMAVALPRNVATVLLVLVGIAVYGMTLLAFRGLPREDLERLPYVGAPLAAFIRLRAQD